MGWGSSTNTDSSRMNLAVASQRSCFGFFAEPQAPGSIQRALGRMAAVLFHLVSHDGAACQLLNLSAAPEKN